MALVYDDAGGSYDFDTDAREALKLDSYVPAPAGDTRPWWERVAEYGMTRAIDNQVGPAAPNKTSTASTFAGQNGKTYTSPVGTTGGSPTQAGGTQKMLMWAALGLAVLGVGYLAFKKG